MTKSKAQLLDLRFLFDCFSNVSQCYEKFTMSTIAIMKPLTWKNSPPKTKVRNGSMVRFYLISLCHNGTCRCVHHRPHLPDIIMPVSRKYRGISRFVVVNPSVSYFGCCRVFNRYDKWLFNYRWKGGKYVKAMRTYNAVKSDTSDKITDMNSPLTTI